LQISETWVAQSRVPLHDQLTSKAACELECHFSYNLHPLVMAGLDPAIHVFFAAKPQDVDARDKRGHDGSTESAQMRRDPHPSLKPYSGTLPLAP
jgi:hypothetical protein